MNLSHFDLFTGLGAFSLGFERQGFKTLAQVEIEKNCLKLLESKWPSVARHNDVTTFDPDSIECPSVVTFGSPCQDLSVAGQRAGMVGERSGLFYHATRIIQRLVGRGLEFALWENVEGAFSSNGRRDFAGVLAELGKCGALDIGWRVLDCQHFGLAQRRRRVFVVADFRARRVAQILSLAEGLQGHPAPCREAGKGTPYDVAPSIGASGRGFSRAGETRGQDCVIPVSEVAHAITAERDGYNDGSDQTYIVMAHGQANSEIRRDGSPSLTCNHEAPIVVGYASPRAIRGSDTSNELGIKDGELHDALQSDGPGAIVFDTTQVTSPGNYSNPKAGEPCHPLAAKGHAPAVAIGFDSKQGGDTQLGATEEVSPPLKGINRHPVAFQPRYFTRDNKTGGAASCGEQSAALSRDHAGGDSIPHVAGNFGVRRLTPTECERLMGLPDNFTAGFSDSVRYRMIGNSAAVPVIEWLAAHLRQSLCT